VNSRLAAGLWLGIFVAVFVWSAIEPKDRVIWVLEASPAVIGLLLIIATYRAFELTPLLYVLILGHCIVLMVGGHYTYAEVPLFDGLFGWERNNYDKVGHFMQGFVPAVLAREIVLRLQVLKSRAWMHLFVVSVCLAFSAFYELIEWWVALVSETSAEAFLGTQGYEWDTQSDMAWALIGVCTALLTLSTFHDRQLKSMKLLPGPVD
jgi:putative membrane protein